MSKKADVVVFRGEPPALVAEVKPRNHGVHMRAVVEWIDGHLKVEAPASEAALTVAEARTERFR